MTELELVTDGRYPDLDAEADQCHVLIVSYAGGTKKALVQFTGLAGGTDNEHLCLDVQAFVDDLEARSRVLGMENVARYTGFGETALGRSHGLPAVRVVAVLIGGQSDTTRAGLAHPTSSAGAWARSAAATHRCARIPRLRPCCLGGTS